jgi:hypothetical protein
MKRDAAGIEISGVPISSRFSPLPDHFSLGVLWRAALPVSDLLARFRPGEP